MKLSTSILNMKKDKENLDKLNNTTTNYIHLDIMDGKFVNNESDMFDFINDNETNKPLDIHLMVEDTISYIEKYSKLNPNNITIHYEIKNNLLESINLIKSKNIKVGLAINPDTDIDEIIKYLDKIDLLLIMSVVPGLGGQSYIDVSNKLKQARLLQQKYNFVIEVDGGIKDNNISTIDTDIAVVGSFITSSDNFQEQINKLNIK
mgnify:FL=1